MGNSLSAATWWNNAFLLRWCERAMPNPAIARFMAREAENYARDAYGLPRHPALPYPGLDGRA